jgi:hypothetical protein
MRICQTLPDFDEVLCQVTVCGDGILRLSEQGMPLFIEHQDTSDRDWCHCARCELAFRKHLAHRLQEGASPGDLGLSSSDVTGIPLPLSPGVAPREFTDRQLPDTPEGERLWHEASKFWTASVAGWTQTLRRTLREFYPSAELATISKYPICRPLTDYAAVAQGNRVFLMDPYPMESGSHWNLSSYLFDIEVYQSAAESAGQALMPHAQAFDNPRPGRTSRPPSPDEYLQQYVGAMSRGASTVVDFTMNHVVELCGPDHGQSRLSELEVDGIVKRRMAIASLLEHAYRGTRCYRGGVLLRYHLPSLCGTESPHPEEAANWPGGRVSLAENLFADYRSWKKRGVPVHVIWDRDGSQPTIPDHHEFCLQGSARGDLDMFIRTGDGRYVVTIINLCPHPRDMHLTIALKGWAKGNWKFQGLAGPEPIAEWTEKEMRVTSRLSGLAWMVFELLDALASSGTLEDIIREPSPQIMPGKECEAHSPQKRGRIPA